MSPPPLELSVILLGASVLYLLHHHLSEALCARGTRGVFLGRLGGFVLLGLASAVLSAFLGLSVPLFGDPRVLGVAAAIWLGLVPVLWVACGGEAHQARYPQVREPEWGRGLWLANAGSWAVHLAGYEFFFRGFLLFGLAAQLGVWPALLISTALYTYAHLPKDLGEGLGCVLMGVVFGVLALEGGVQAPFLLHLGIALSSDGFSRRRATWRAA